MASKAHEPRGLTTLDLLVIVAASASIFAVRIAFPFPRGQAAATSDVPPWAFPYFRVGWALFDLDIVTALVVVARRVRYSGMPRPAEWLAVMLAANALVLILPKPWDLGKLGLRQGLRYPYATKSYSPSLYSLYPGGTVLVGVNDYLRHVPAYEPLIYNTIAASLVLALSTPVALARLGPTLPCWLKTALVAFAGLCLLWGPASIAAFAVPEICHTQSDGHPDWLRTAFDRFGLAIGRIPAGLIVAVPAYAAWARLRGTRRAPGRWTEWVGLGTGLAFALQRALDVVVAATISRGAPSPFRGWDWKTSVVSFRFFDFIVAPVYGDSSIWLASTLVFDRLSLALWGYVVFALSRWIVRRFLPHLALSAVYVVLNDLE